MAKVKGPLMSMDARGQLGKTLVFIGWKGIKDVRSFVIPANPKTAGQVTQRGIMTDAVALFHFAVFNVLDMAALNVWASIQAAIMSGFNVFCKKFIEQVLLGLSVVAPSGMVISANTGGSFGISLKLAGVSAGKVRYGSSPTVMGSIASLTHSGEGQPYTATLSGFTAGEYVYLQAYTEVSGIYWDTGIYKVLILA